MAAARLATSDGDRLGDAALADQQYGALDRRAGVVDGCKDGDGFVKVIEVRQDPSELELRQPRRTSAPAVASTEYALRRIAASSHVGLGRSAAPGPVADQAMAKGE